MAAKLSPWGPVSPRTSKLSPRHAGKGGRRGQGGPESVTIFLGCHQQTPGLLYAPFPLPPNPIRLFSRASSHEQREISSFVRQWHIFIKRSTSKILDRFTLLVLIRGQTPLMCDSNMIVKTGELQPFFLLTWPKKDIIFHSDPYSA